MTNYSKNTGKDRINAMKFIIQTIKKHRSITLEDLSDCTGIEYRTIAELTAILEIDGFICIDLLQRCSINYKIV